MKAVCLPIAPNGEGPFTASKPAPSSALEVCDIPQPIPSQPGDILVQIKATTVIRDNLAWPELYAEKPAQLGNDFAGVVVSVYGSGSAFEPGDEVYGMLSAHKGGSWAEYALVTEEEACLKPATLSWEEAAALSLSALTADQALFEQARLSVKVSSPGTQKRVLITGAAGGVGTYLVQFALAAGHEVVAGTSSRARNGAFLQSLGLRADATPEYSELSRLGDFDAIIDTRGGDVLRRSWAWVKGNGCIVSIDSSSWNFVEEHQKQGLVAGKESVRAMFFIVEPSAKSMARISDAVHIHGLKVVLSKVMTLRQAKEAYDLCHNGQAGRGKIVLVP